MQTNHNPNLKMVLKIISIYKYDDVLHCDLPITENPFRNIKGNRNPSNSKNQNQKTKTKKTCSMQFKQLVLLITSVVLLCALVQALPTPQYEIGLGQQIIPKLDNLDYDHALKEGQRICLDELGLTRYKDPNVCLAQVEFWFQKSKDDDRMYQYNYGDQQNPYKWIYKKGGQRGKRDYQLNSLGREYTFTVRVGGAE
jgi:hypothetical protein